MPDLPAFTRAGVLPAGDYPLTLDELLVSPLVIGWGDDGQCDVSWRRKLAKNLAALIGHLWAVGIQDIFVDGSFAEEKPHPNDIDGYFVCEKADFYSGKLQARLRKLDSVWNWQRRYAAAGSSKRQLAMWHKYRVELFPHVGQGTGILDKHGHELDFPSAFRQNREAKPKGIVRIVGAP